MPGWSSTSTSATPSACASTASAASRSPCCSRRWAGPPSSIQARFGFSETILATLEKDHTAGQDEALLDIYRKLRPGEPPTRESAQTLLENLFFKDKRYDLAKVGRYKANKKLGLAIETSVGTLTEEDIATTIEYLVRLHAGETSMIVGAAEGEQRSAGRSRSRPTTSTTSATAACAPWAS